MLLLMKKILTFIVLSFLWFDISHALPVCEGEDYTKFKNCIGTIKQDGNKFISRYGDEPGVMKGVAFFEYSNGNTYIGETKNYNPNGLGILRIKDGSFYIGQSSNQIMTGWGIFYWKKNNKYVLGQLKDHSHNGFAAVVDPTDMLTLQRGIFKNNNYFKNSKKIEPQCKGSYINPIESKDWTSCRGEFNAAGLFYDSDFTNGVPNGIAWVRLFEGELSKALGHEPYTYVGELKISKDTGWGERTGMGITLLDDHMIQVGSYNEGYYHGKGISVWPNGDIYIGFVKKDKRNGQGDYIAIDGTWESGQWKNNKLNGSGFRFFPNGSMQYGTFKEDKFVK